MSSSRLATTYQTEIRPALQKQLGISNVMAVPRLERIMVNVGAGKFLKNEQAFKSIEADLAAITGQKVVRAQARKSIASFNIREGMNVGLFTTLRGERMYDFLDRLISISLPRVRDFRGLSDSSFDGRGNYTFGVPDQEIFAEVNHDDISTTFGLQITIVTTAETDDHGRALLRALGFPLTKEEVANEHVALEDDSQEARAEAAKQQHEKKFGDSK